MNAILDVREFGVFHGAHQVVHEIGLRIPRGGIVTVIGANGAGKTTMLFGLMGLLRTTGEVRFQGDVIDAADTESRVAMGLSLVPEQRALFGTMTVRDNLDLGTLAGSRKTAREQKRSLDFVYDLFPRLKERSRQVANTLSGGERQMLALGRALMGKPRMLMLDEPSLGLAPLIVASVFEVIAELKRTDVSILLVEQNARAALQIADYGYVLEAGALRLEGSAETLLGDPMIVDAYLGASSAS